MRTCDCPEAIRLITCAHEGIDCEIWWTCDIDLGKVCYYWQGDLPRPEIDGQLGGCGQQAGEGTLELKMICDNESMLRRVMVIFV